MIGLIRPEDAAASRQQTIQIPAPNVSRPEGVADGWIYVPKDALTPQTIVLGILREAVGPMPVSEIVARVREYDPEIHPGTVANIGTRLVKSGHVERTDNGWRLLDKSRAPILNGKYAWGPAEDVFMKQEVAARRREAILHVLGMNPSGLMNLQIVEQLEVCPWLKTPVNSDLVKADMEDLRAEGLVKRSGATKKWVLASEVTP